MTRIHLDTDLGGDIDDLCALALLLRWPAAEITGVTTVAEDGGRRAGYARYALALAGRADIPVAAGVDAAYGPYRHPIPALFPREDRYWPAPVPRAPTPVADALALLKRSVEGGARIVATGPYTNLALLDTAYPGLLRRAALYLMGGHVHPIPDGFPAWGDNMDDNIQFDVASARRVLVASFPTLIPIEVTVQTALRRAHIPALRASGPLGALLARQADALAEDWQIEERYGRPCSGLPDDTINFLHDPLACAVALGWDGVSIEETRLRLDLRDGWLHEQVDPAGHAVRIVTAVDAARFAQIWVQVMTA